MTGGKESLLAVCGLECVDCDIRLLPTDPKAAGRVVAWFKNMGWLEQDEGVAQVIERSMYCQGCHGDRSIHWSAECWILQCCVDDKGLQHFTNLGGLDVHRLPNAPALARLALFFKPQFDTLARPT